MLLTDGGNKEKDQRERGWLSGGEKGELWAKGYKVETAKLATAVHAKTPKGGLVEGKGPDHACKVLLQLYKNIF